MKKDLRLDKPAGHSGVQHNQWHAPTTPRPALAPGRRNGAFRYRQEPSHRRRERHCCRQDRHCRRLVRGRSSGHRHRADSPNPSRTRQTRHISARAATRRYDPVPAMSSSSRCRTRTAGATGTRLVGNIARADARPGAEDPFQLASSQNAFSRTSTRPSCTATTSKRTTVELGAASRR